jgi:hypothetical protein
MLANVKKYKFYLFVLFIWALSTAAKIKFNGLVFGFDYGIYQPDGKFYTYMTLDFINHNPLESARSVVNWYAKHGFKMNTFSTADLIPGSSYAYPLIEHRILYPLLSVPFVMLLGIPGMLAVPIISYLILLVCLQKLSIHLQRPWVGISLAILLSSSPTVLRWMIVNCTDSLLVGLFAFVPAVLIRINENRNRYISFLLILVIATSATRFVLPIWLGIAVVLYLNKIRFTSIAIFFFSTICSIPALAAQTSTALLPNSQGASTFHKILELPISFFRVVTIDFLEFAVLDRILLILMVFTIFIAIKKIKSQSSQYFLMTLMSTYTIGAINGTLGVNFRYQMPVLIFLCWVVLDHLDLIKVKTKNLN